MKLFTLLLSIFLSIIAYAQQIELLTEGTKTSIRGLSLPNEHTIWVSGSNGYVGYSLDGGKEWHFMQVQGFEKRDFRDIHAFNDSVVLIMAVDNPGLILKTSNYGKTWKVVFEKNTPGMFLDAFTFEGNKGVCIGDPLTYYNQKQFFYTLFTDDGGNNWYETDLNSMIKPLHNAEGLFAGSGTNVVWLNARQNSFAFISGGIQSNLYIKHSKKTEHFNIPIIQNSSGAGAFAMVKDKHLLYIVGGDYTKPEYNQNNFAIFNLKFKKWMPLSNQSPSGYRCGIAKSGTYIVVSGSNGIDWSANEGKSWTKIDSGSYNVVMALPENKGFIVAGMNGKIVKLY